MIRINQNQKIKFLIQVILLKRHYHAKITEIEGKIPDVSNLATKTALTTVENNKYLVLVFQIKKDYNAKITEIGKITSSKFNTLAADVFNVRLAKTNFVTKTNFDNTVSSLNSKIVKSKT